MKELPVIQNEQQTEEIYRDSISTVDAQGKRIWVYPKKPKGKFYDYRKYVSYFLLIVLFGMPFIKHNGEPIMLFNILENKFIILGVYFAPQDFHLLVLAMLIGIIFIALFTVIYGRLFCGWVCPQTIFMEMVFRRIEYWIEGDANAQIRLNKADWNQSKFIKKAAKHIIFIFISAIIAHTFLSYIIGIDSMISIMTDPIGKHWQGLLAMIIFTSMFYGVFAFMREQVCTTICPYGRLQGVLLDEKSLAVAYDFERGEPRTKLNKNKLVKKKVCSDGCNSCSGNKNCESSHHNELMDIITPKVGDCISCNLCVKVCPTGIDIRNGTQLECVNCTACMDACDEVMTKINRPKGLIRIDSQHNIINGTHSIWSTRVAAYSVVLIVLTLIECFLFYSRTEVETLLLRTPGMLFQETDDGYISNLYNYQIINKSSKEQTIYFEAEGISGVLFEVIGDPPKTHKHQVSEGAVFIKIPKDQVLGRKTELTINVLSDGKIIDQAETNFLGPNHSKK